MATLSQEEVSKRVSVNSDGRLTLISQYGGRNSKVILHCNIHNLDFEASGDAVTRTPIRCNCPQCSKEKKNDLLKENRTEVECAYCKKKFFKANSKLKNSRSGLFFCCKEHKDLAQRLTSGEEFEAIRPEHYGSANGIFGYRQRAFKDYPHKCSVCGWDEDENLLEVHHIDENRQNGEKDNLIILCPLCHRKLTSKKYVLKGRTEIIKV